MKTLSTGVFRFERSRNNCQYSPLHAAVQYGCIHGDLIVFQYILARTGTGACNGLTPLHIAAQLSNLEITKQILKKVNGKISSDNSGMTPHHYAALNGDLDMFKTLFDHFSDKIQASNGFTPLYYAAKHGRLDICKYII